MRFQSGWQGRKHQYQVVDVEGGDNICFKNLEGLKSTAPPFPLKRLVRVSSPKNTCNDRGVYDTSPQHQVLTEAWQSTRVRVSIEDCTPRTAVIAAFGAEPTPSRHELLAHAMMDLAGNGTCGVDVITRPSYSRDGVWCVIGLCCLVAFFVSLLQMCVCVCVCMCAPCTW